MKDLVHLYHRLVALRPVGARILSKWPFRSSLLGQNPPFKPTFRKGWHKDAIARTTHHWQRLAEESTAHPCLIHTKRGHSLRCQQITGRQSQSQRDGKILPLLFYTGEDVPEVLWQNERPK